MAKHEYRIEINDFLSKDDECVTTVLAPTFRDPEEAAELGWQLMIGISKMHDAEIENQGDQFMVYLSQTEGSDYDDLAGDGGVLYTLRVLDENNQPYEDL